MPSQPAEAEACNVVTALNGIRRHSSSTFTVTATDLAQRAQTDVETVERVIAQLETRPGHTITETGAGEWEVCQS